MGAKPSKRLAWCREIIDGDVSAWGDDRHGLREDVVRRFRRADDGLRHQAVGRVGGEIFGVDVFNRVAVPRHVSREFIAAFPVAHPLDAGLAVFEFHDGREWGIDARADFVTAWDGVQFMR